MCTSERVLYLQRHWRGGGSVVDVLVTKVTTIGSIKVEDGMTIREAVVKSS
jgi:hypothetical protein